MKTKERMARQHLVDIGHFTEEVKHVGESILYFNPEEIEIYTAGFDACEKKILADASEGFEVKTARDYMEQAHKMSNDDFCFIYNKLLIPVYQTLVPLNIKKVMDFTFDYAFDSGRQASRQSAQKELAEKDTRIKELESVRELPFNGLAQELEDVIAGKDAQIAELRKEIAEKDEKLRRQEYWIGVLDNQVDAQIEHIKDVLTRDNEDRLKKMMGGLNDMAHKMGLKDAQIAELRKDIEWITRAMIDTRPGSYYEKDRAKEIRTKHFGDKGEV